MSDANSSLTIRVGTSGVAAAMSEISALGEVIKSLAAPITALASGAGFIELARSGLQFASQLARVKQVVGGTVQDMAGLAYAGERAGINLDALQTSLKMFSEYLVKTGQGHRSLKEALLEEAAIFQSMPNGVQKTARAVELFGRSGIAMIPLLNQGPAALEKLFERGAELSGVTAEMAKNNSEFNHSLGDLKMAAEGFAATLVSGVLPSLTHLIESAADGMVKFRQWSQCSETFRIALEALAVTLGLLAGGWLANRLAAKFLITTLSDIPLLLPVISRMVMASLVEFGLWAIAIAAVTAVVVAGIEAWKLYQAKREEAQSAQAAREAMATLATAIAKNIDAQVQAGTLGAASADQMKQSVNALTEEWKRGGLSLDEYRQKLDALAAQLRTTQPKAPPVTAPVFLTPEILAAFAKDADSLYALELSTRQSQAQTDKAFNDAELQRYGELYRKKLITAEAYFAKKKELEAASVAAEKAPLLYRLDRIDDEVEATDNTKARTDKTDVQALATLDTKRNELLAERARIVSQLFQINARLSGLQAQDAGKLDTEQQKVQLEALELDHKQRMLALDEQLATVEGNYLLTSVQKYEEKKKLLEGQAAALRAYIASLKLLATFQDPATAKGTLAHADAAGQQLGQTNRSMGALGPDPKSFKAQFASVLTDLQNQWGTFATQAATTFKTVFDDAISTISRGITGLIMGTETWSQALSNIGMTILESIIGAIIQMGIRWVATQIMMAIVGKSILAASVAATAPIAAAQSAVWAAPATLSTIATYGASALSAPGFIAAAEGITLGESALSFAEGGYTGPGGKHDVAGIVHRGEFVMPADSVNRIGLPKLEALKSGASTGGPTTVEGHKVNLHFYDSRPHPRDFLSSSEGENMVVNIARKHRVKIGVGT